MRLICGVVRLDGAPASGDTVNAMFAALTAPGLEPHAVRWVDGPAALGVLDFSGDARAIELPRGEDGSVLAADIRLDRADGEDQEQVALAAFSQWGPDVPDRLHGDFALAKWNPRTRDLMLARDIIGARPLCYTHQPGRCFAFASFPHGLFGADVVAPSLELQTIACTFVQRHVRSSATGFQNISWLLPAHSLVLTSRGLDLHRAWRPDPAQVGSFKGSSEEAAAIVRSLVEEAVESRTRGQRPVAVHLSGGLDSSTVTVVAARKLRAQGRTLYAYSMLAEPVAGRVIRDEKAHVDAVLAQEPGIVATPVYLSPRGAMPVFDSRLPFGVASGSPEDRVCADAARAGVRMLLSGAGGDEGASYNGADLYASLLRERKWRHLVRQLRARARVDRRPLWRVAFGRLVVPFLPPVVVSLWQKRRNQLTGEERRRLISSFLEPSLADEILEMFPADSEGSNRAHDRIQVLAEGFLFKRHTLWATVAARHGMAVSHPLTDRRILDFCLTLPTEHLLQGGFSRQPLREAMAGILPDSIRLRTTKFSVFPDVPERLMAALPELLSRAERLRGETADRLFNPEAIIGALREATRHQGEVIQASPEVGRGGFPRWYRMVMHAYRALVLAEQVQWWRHVFAPHVMRSS